MKNNLKNSLNQHIVKIVIHTYSGYWESHYSDTLSITADSIKYEYQELANPTPIKWYYSSNNHEFQQQFELICKKLIEILEIELPKEYFALDVGGLNFTITYANKKELKKTMMVPNNYFEDVFTFIKPIIPQFEQLPEFMKTYDEDDCDDDSEFSEEF